MSVFDDIDGILPGLLPAAWRGIRFWTINAQHQSADASTRCCTPAWI